jgi:hypothetical protein
MRYKIKQYYPSFCEGFEPEIAGFKTIDEFLKIEFVGSFTRTNGFLGFKVYPDSNAIFAVYKNSQWCVARVSKGNITALDGLFSNKWRHIISDLLSEVNRLEGANNKEVSK